MSRAGDVIENPITGERAIVILGTEETGGERIVADLYVQPGGSVAGEHVHASVDERFTVIRGKIGFRIDGREDIVGPGRTLRVPAGVKHDWWNAGEQEARVRVEVTPGLRFEELILNLAGLAQDGKTNARGMPGLLQTVLLAREFEDVVVFPHSSRRAQRLLYTCLAPFARLLGYRGSYPEYRERLLRNRILREQETVGAA